VVADRGLLETTGGLLFLTMIMPVLYPLTVHNTWMTAACLFLIGFSGAMGFPLQPHLMDVTGRAQTMAAAMHHAAFRSFCDQILPSSSVTLGWSSWAVQGLSRVPVLIPDHKQVAYSRDAGARAAFAQQAAEDWRCFLTHRAAELRPGGRLVVLSMTVDEHGDFGYRPAVAAIYGGIMDLVEEGFVKEEQGGAADGDTDAWPESPGMRLLRVLERSV
jgi:hypothetical protein